jgi:hypothetical protein
MAFACGLALFALPVVLEIEDAWPSQLAGVVIMIIAGVSAFV